MGDLGYWSSPETVSGYRAHSRAHVLIQSVVQKPIRVVGLQ